MVELKHEADVLVAERRELVRLHRPEIDVADPHRIPPSIAVETAEHVQQRALADARRADDRDHLARLDDQIELPQHRHLVAPTG